MPPVRIIESQKDQDLNEIKGQIEDLQNTINNQQQDIEQRDSCEAYGGKYLGNGSCCIRNCSNWIGQ